MGILKVKWTAKRITASPQFQLAFEALLFGVVLYVFDVASDIFSAFNWMKTLPTNSTTGQNATTVCNFKKIIFDPLSRATLYSHMSSVHPSLQGVCGSGHRLLKSWIGQSFEENYFGYALCYISEINTV